jgi:hypothetical protein
MRGEHHRDFRAQGRAEGGVGGVDVELVVVQARRFAAHDAAADEVADKQGRPGGDDERALGVAADGAHLGVYAVLGEGHRRGHRGGGEGVEGLGEEAAHERRPGGGGAGLGVHALGGLGHVACAHQHGHLQPRRQGRRAAGVIGVGVGDHDRRHLVLSDPGLSEALERGFVIARVAGVDDHDALTDQGVEVGVAPIQLDHLRRRGEGQATHHPRGDHSATNGAASLSVESRRPLGIEARYARS